MARARNSIILSGQTAPELNRELNFILQRLVDRIDRLEGIRGTSTIESDLVMSGNQVRSVADGAVSTDAPNLSQIASDIETHIAEVDPHPGLIEDLEAVNALALDDTLMVNQGGENLSATTEDVRDLVWGDDWDDMIVAATAVNPTGLAAPPALNGDTGCLEFSGTVDNTICGCWQLSHGWTAALTDGASGYIVRPHLHVRFLTSTATNTRWKLEVDRVVPNGTHENTYGNFTTVSTITVENPQNVNKSALVPFGDLDMTGYTKGSALIHFRISRLANSDAADNYTGVVALYSMDCHMQRRAAGSETELPAGV